MARRFVGARSGWRWRLTPPATLAVIYLVFTLLGGVLLWLPVSNHGDVSAWDALFTSTSAVTVTGLIVVDTGSAFTPFGQVVIALLIQLGGLGLMAFAVMLLTLLGIPIGLPYRVVLREEVNQKALHNLTDIARVIITVALLCELIGAALLSFVFVPELGWAKGIGHALFHSVSAFNNAGFALYPDSLMGYASDPIINLVIPALFILGGLGFIVLADLYEVRQWRRLTLHSKLMIVGTVALIGFSWPMFAALEWTNPGTLGGLPDTGSRIWASWFQAVTTRTAGFNSIDTGAMHDSTTLMTMALMVVGGGSTSTAGGIKVTTLIVLVIATIAFFKRQTQLNAFGRSLGADEVQKVLALTMVSMLVVLTGIFVTSISHDGDFLDLAFEVTSAFGTVGLSRGATGELDGVGRAVIMLIMFLGRVGPLTLGFFLATRSVPRVRYPKGQVYLG
ncbi:trk system potassium uptake protein TrkH [Roseovarius nanhaiticus]|uniref:Trk system potassium uptake protein TrkH n=1 Tax=Roseovarius nanhaiticus TaxID=573024 RepID=A0A1N7EFH8_9RHOB|nr:TrkH family potassium uptake protein [Roseovarius nanhaiticus]SEK75808.1 trk system potassium uptake protein TrkH [Roseovarius nanhaiticus]SIR86779.1 trk system potassium uptake protein TrkH [Roseovarius nanhaiticus]